MWRLLILLILFGSTVCLVDFMRPAGDDPAAVASRSPASGLARPVIHIRDVPGHIYRRLAEQAEREHRSLAQQTLAVLARGLEVGMDAKARRKKVLEAIAGMDHSQTKKLRDPVRLIREDRNR
jgi:hypothetical protein